MIFTGIFFLIILAVCIGALIVAIFYYITLQDTLKLVAPHNRTIRPGQVWLSLIPLFGLVWNFIMVTRIADSIERELKSRGLPVDRRPGYAMGLTMSILQCIPSAYQVYPGDIKMVTVPGGLAFVFLIIYWVQIAEYKKTLQATQGSKDNDSLIFPPYK